MRLVDILHNRKAATVLVILGAAMIWLHSQSQPTPDRSKTIEYGTALFGAIIALYTFLTKLEADRIEVSRRLIERWNNVEFATIRGSLSEIVHGLRPIQPADRIRLLAVLNFYEEIALTVLAGRAEEKLLIDFFKGVVVSFWQPLQDWIGHERLTQPAAFTQFEKLVYRWR